MYSRSIRTKNIEACLINLKLYPILCVNPTMSRSKYLQTILSIHELVNSFNIKNPQHHAVFDNFDAVHIIYIFIEYINNL